MNPNRNRPSTHVDVFAGLLDSSAAAAAAARIYETHEGLRFCSENGECCSADEARAQNAREATRHRLTTTHESLSELAGGRDEFGLTHPDPAEMTAMELDDIESDIATDNRLIDVGDDAMTLTDDDEDLTLDNVQIMENLLETL